MTIDRDDATALALDLHAIASDLRASGHYQRSGAIVAAATFIEAILQSSAPAAPAASVPQLMEQADRLESLKPAEA